jgi:hypothetical protein
MANPRPQFRLSTLLWLTLAVACWFGGMTYERWRADREYQLLLNEAMKWPSYPLPDRAAF